MKKVLKKKKKKKLAKTRKEDVVESFSVRNA